MRLFPENLQLRMRAIVCAVIMIGGDGLAYGEPGADREAAAMPENKTLLSPDSLDSLVAPIALYPDPLVAQVLAAATYPLHMVEASRWLKANSSQPDQELVHAAAKQDWDPSIQALVLFPSVVDQMDANLKWTTALGNALLAQPRDIMLAVQRLRQKAYSAGALKTNANQKVEVERLEGATVIVVQPISPEVMYVPSYDPAVVFGAAPIYAPYPVIAYPPPTVGVNPISFGAGVAVGAALGGWRGGAWGWGCTWGAHPTLYVNNSFVNQSGFRGSAYAGRSGTGTWAHNPYYRGAVPYSSTAVTKRYGTAAGVRTGNGAAASVAGPNRSVAAISTPRSAAAAVSGPNGAAIATHPNGSGSGAVVGPRGEASRLAGPDGAAANVPRGTFTDPQPSAFGAEGADRARQSSVRGNASMGGGRTAGRLR